MDDLLLLAAKASRLRDKRADDGSGQPVLGAAEGLGAAGLLAGTANWARNTYNRVQPSILQMGEGIWHDHHHAGRLDSGLSRAGANSAEVLRQVRESPGVLRRVLLGDRTSGISNQTADLIRDLTWGGRNRPTMTLPGDVLLHADNAELGSGTERARNLISGQALNHASISGGGERVYSFGNDARLRGTVAQTPMRDLRSSATAFVRLRDKQLTPEQQHSLANAVPETYERQVSRGGKSHSMPFDTKKMSDLSLREAVPELATADGRSLLSRPADWLAGNRWLGRVTKPLLSDQVHKSLFGYRRLGAACGPGEVCSTMAGRALASVGAPVAAEMSPGDVGRNIGPGKRFAVEEVHLPAEMRNKRFLLGSHWRRLGPAAVRGPLMLGAAGLGLYGLNDALGRLRSGKVNENPAEVLPAQPVREAPVSRPTPPIVSQPQPAPKTTGQSTGGALMNELSLLAAKAGLLRIKQAGAGGIALGAGLLGLGGLGYAGYRLLRPSQPPPPQPEQPPEEQQPQPQPPPRMTARQATISAIMGKARQGVGGWWKKMQARYGGEQP